MAERINRKTDHKVYQPRIHCERIQELYVIKELTKRPLTVLVDEALALYLSSFALSPEYKDYQAKMEAGWRQIDEKIDEMREPDFRDTDAWEDFDRYFPDPGYE